MRKILLLLALSLIPVAANASPLTGPVMLARAVSPDQESWDFQPAAQLPGTRTPGSPLEAPELAAWMATRLVSNLQRGHQLPELSPGLWPLIEFKIPQPDLELKLDLGE